MTPSCPRPVLQAGAEIGFDHLFIGAHILGGAGRQHGALGHHDDRIAQPRNEIHVMFNHAECVSALAVQAQNGIADGSEKGPVDAGPDLVEKHDLGIDHHRPAKLEELLLPA